MGSSRVTKLSSSGEHEYECKYREEVGRGMQRRRGDGVCREMECKGKKW
jgi:hypothetical protein